MAIIGTLPVTLQNGTIADATQVMADFNFIVNAVNSGALASSALAAAMLANPALGSLIEIQEITASAAYVPNPNANAAILDFIPAGGAGGGTPSSGSGGQSAAGGGAAGNFLRVWIPASLQTYSGTAITIGAAGAGVAGAQGGNGGNITFGSIITAYGGVGGSPGFQIAGPIGGAAVSFLLATSSINTNAPTITAPPITTTKLVGILGAAGGDGFGSSTAFGFTRAGDGGSNSPFGSGGYGTRIGSFGSAGTAGSGYGAGGGGAAVSGTSVALAGFSGAPGVVIAYHFV